MGVAWKERERERESVLLPFEKVKFAMDVLGYLSTRNFLVLFFCLCVACFCVTSA